MFSKKLHGEDLLCSNGPCSQLRVRPLPTCTIFWLHRGSQGGRNWGSQGGRKDLDAVNEEELRVLVSQRLLNRGFSLSGVGGWVLGVRVKCLGSGVYRSGLGVPF